VAPHRDAIRIDAVEAGDELHGVEIAAGLHPRIDLARGLAIARAEAAMVVEKHCAPRLVEGLGISVDGHRARGRKAVRHHDDRGKRDVRLIEPAAQGGSERGKFDVDAHRILRYPCEWLPSRYARVRVAALRSR